MSEIANKMWLNDENGVKIAPRTLISAIQDEDGNVLQDDINNMLIMSTDETTDIPNDIVSSITNQDLYNIVSDAYDSTKTYTIGDYCIYNNILYKCTTAIDVTEEFDDTKWEKTDCGSEFSQLNNNLSGIDITCTIVGVTHTDEYPNSYKCVRYGNSLHISGDITTNDTGILLSVPTDCIPKHTVMSASCMVISDNNKYFLRLHTSGNLILYKNNGVASGNSRCIFDVTFDLG